MKITQINVQNFQGLRAANLKLHAPVAVFAGPNGAGKSSLRDALKMGLSGAATRVSKKKDYEQLVTDGQKGGSITVELADGRRSEVVLPAGDITFFGKQVEDPDKARAALPYVLSPELFAAASADDRRTVLFTLTGCAATTDEVQKRLAERGADPVKVEAVLPLVRAGFPEAEKYAKTHATEAKGAWRGITGETYGEKKAEGWKAEAPEVSEQSLMQAEADLDEVDGAIAGEQQKLGELQATFAAQKERAGQITLLDERAGRIDKIKRKLMIDDAELAEWEQKVAAVRAAAAGEAVAPHWECPCCQNLLTLNKAGSLEQYVPPAQVPDTEAKIKLPEYEKSRDLLANCVANGKRDLAAAEAAEVQLREWEASDAQLVVEGDIRAKEAKIALLRASCKQLAADLEALRAQARAAADAQRKTTEAAKHHADVKAWSLIADAMAPDGIPGALLNAALLVVNDHLFAGSQLAEWPRVQISRDMDITADGRLYGLLSESEQWRADCVIALMLAALSKLKLVVLDRFDVLDMAGRKQLIGLLDELAFSGQIDTAVVCGTLKQAPSLPDTMQAFWVENGEAVAVPLQEERAAA